MKKQEYTKLLAEIGGGGEIIGQEVHDTRLKAEEEVTAAIWDHYGTLFVFGDAVHQFYIDTIREFSARLQGSTSQVVQVSLHWHTVSSARYFVTFDLFRRGYFFESANLARTLWETALTLAALKMGILPLEELFGGRLEDGVKLDPSNVIKRIRNADTMVQDTLIRKNCSLSKAAREAILTFETLMNQATHKSNLALVTNIRRQLQGETIPIFPRFDPVYMEMSWNILFQSVWSLMITVSYLDELLPTQDSLWQARYDKLMLVFIELNKDAPNPALKGFGEVIEKVFMLTTEHSSISQGRSKA